MNADRDANFDSGFYDVLIQDFATPSHIVPLPWVVVVVLVVSETCPHANGATTANAMLKSIFFMFPFLV